MSGSYRLEFEIAGLPRTLNSRGNWKSGHYAAQRWISDVAKAIGARKPATPLKSARLELTRISSVAMDHDNLVSGFKPIIDGLVRAGVLVNDKWENIGMPTYRWERCKPKEGRIRVLVESEGEKDAKR